MEEALRAIANPRRRAMLSLVRDAERSAGDIASAGALSPAVGRAAAATRLREVLERRA